MCDKCGIVFKSGERTEFPNTYDPINDAMNEGWKHTSIHTFCPDCWNEINKR